VFKFQLHDYIARKILHQPPQSCNDADNKEVGARLNNILKEAGTEVWRKVLKDATGEDISTRAMMDYFKPLMSWLEEQNKGARSAGNEIQGAAAFQPPGRLQVALP
jgi:peptidyl-dipeptidase A